MKKIIVLGTTLAAVTTATTIALISKAKKVKAEKAEAIELEKIAADIDGTTETVVDDSEISWEDSHETYESESVPVTDEEEIQMCEESVNTYDADETEEEAEEDDSEVYHWTVQYCPRLEDGEKCKTEHDTKLEFLEGENTNVFTKISHKNHYNWDEHQEVINGIKEFFEHQFEQEFKVDFVGYELFTRPFVMGHIGNDPRNSILCRPYPIKEFIF